MQAAQPTKLLLQSFGLLSFCRTLNQLHRYLYKKGNKVSRGFLGWIRQDGRENVEFKCDI